jgi:hypothetical protein
MYRTSYGVCLDALTTRLSGYAKDDDLHGGDWAKAIIEGFLLTPAIWPLSDELFEILLGWAGVDLDDAAGVEFAVAISQYLDGTGICPVVCTHPTADPSPRCARVRAGELSDVYDRGVLYDGTHDREFWLDLRTRITVAFTTVVDTADIDAEALDTDEEYPDAA